MAVEITESHVHDSRVLPRLLMQISGKVCQISGDGAYDTKACYESIGQRGAKATTPPRRNAKRMRCSTPPTQLAIRGANLRQNSTARPVCLARSQWWYTTELGGECRVSVYGYLWFPVQGARRVDNQRVEGWVKCRVLNRMVSLGMPVSERMY